MQKTEEPKPPLKTYLVKIAIATNGLDGSRDNYELKLIKASDLAAANECAWLSEGFVPEGFDDEHEEDQGEWCTRDGKRAFEIKADACDVDAGCVYWLDEITELPTEDAIVLGKYLPVSLAEPAVP